MSLEPTPAAVPAAPDKSVLTRIRVALIEDSTDYAAGLAAFLNSQPDLEVCGIFRTADDVRPSITAARPNVILLDIGLPGESGLSLLPQLPELAPGSETLVLTTFEDPGTIAVAVEHGASGFVLKRGGLVEIVAAVRKVAAGGVALSDSVARELLQQFRKRRQTASLLPNLSPQENRLLMLLSEGQSLKQAAAAAGITYETSRRYMVSIYRKLRVNSMTQALTYYLRSLRG
jgi:DNA-binding NarL/FixJ family response regulator